MASGVTVPWKASDPEKVLLEHHGCRREAEQRLQSSRDGSNTMPLVPVPNNSCILFL